MRIQMTQPQEARGRSREHKKTTQRQLEHDNRDEQTHLLLGFGPSLLLAPTAAAHAQNLGKRRSAGIAPDGQGRDHQLLNQQNHETH
jgi:hypothetical protein